MRYLIDNFALKFVGNFTKAGITLGSCLAVVVSYSAWQSIPWAILHGVFSWAYVIYYAIHHAGKL